MRRLGIRAATYGTLALVVSACFDVASCDVRCPQPTESVHELSSATVVEPDPVVCGEPPFRDVATGSRVIVRVWPRRLDPDELGLALVADDPRIAEVGATTIDCGCDAGGSCGTCTLLVPVTGLRRGRFRLVLMDRFQRELDFFVADVF